MSKAQQINLVNGSKIVIFKKNFVLNLCIFLILLDLFPDFRRLFHLSFLKVLFLAEELYPSPKME